MVEAEGLEPPKPKAADLQSALIAARVRLSKTCVWNLVESNHVLKIFSLAHTPSLPKFLFAEAKGFEALRRFRLLVFKTSAIDQLCQTSISDEGGTRTHNRLLRRQLLCPVELPHQ